MIKEINSEAKKILFHCYKEDINFPKSCGAVSMTLACILQTIEHITAKYLIKYHRGHFRNDNEYEECFCDIAEEDCLRFNSDLIKNIQCINCTCEYMVGHSWVELINKENQEITILDFTSIQFEDEFPDYESELLESDFNKDELFNYLIEKSQFYVHKKDSRFNKYLRTEQVVTGEYILNKTKEVYSDNSVSDLTLILDNIGFEIMMSKL